MWVHFAFFPFPPTERVTISWLDHFLGLLGEEDSNLRASLKIFSRKSADYIISPALLYIALS